MKNAVHQQLPWVVMVGSAADVCHAKIRGIFANFARKILGT
jgi:hypothetical protein